MLEQRKNECMRKSKVMTGWSKRIQLMCVDEKKRGKVTSRGGNGAGTSALAFFCKLDDIGRDRLPNVRGEALSIFRRESRKGAWPMAGAGGNIASSDDFDCIFCRRLQLTRQSNPFIIFSFYHKEFSINYVSSGLLDYGYNLLSRSLTA